MGLDFIKRNAPTFTKTWDSKKNNLSEPTLFTEYAECRTRTLIADISEYADLKEGTNVIVHAKGLKLILISGITQIGEISEPPIDLQNAIQNAGDYALGRIARLNSLSGTADVEIE